MPQFQRRNNYKPGTQDDCQTPPYAVTDELVTLFKDYFVWECATGEGYLYRELNRQGVHIFDTELKHHNFLTDDPYTVIDLTSVNAIITNPPYSLATSFLDQCMNLRYPFALLLRAEILFTSTYHKLCNEHQIYPAVGVLSSRVDFKMPNKGWEGAGAHFPVAWFIYHPKLKESVIYYWRIYKPKHKDVSELSKFW